MANETQEAITIRGRFTLTQVIIALVTASTLLLGPPLANYYSSAVRDDPFTGSRGDEHEDRIDSLETASESCKSRNNAHDEWIRIQSIRFEALRDKVHGFQERKNEMDKSQDYLIKRCMERTQPKRYVE